MKKYFLFIIICIGSFMIYTNNVKAEEYRQFNLNGLSCSGSACNSYNADNNWFFINSANNLTQSSATINFNSVSTPSGYNGFLVNVGLSYFDETYFETNSSTPPNYVCTESINESGTITYADGTSARVALGAECTEWGANGQSSTSSSMGTNRTGTIQVSLGYRFNGGANTYNQCYLKSANDFNMVFDCPFSINPTINSIEKFIFVFQSRTDTQVKVTLNRWALNFYKTDASRIITAIENQTSSINSKLDELKQNQQATTQAVNEQTNTIKNDNTSGAEGSADSLKNNSAFQDNSGLSAVISMPLTFVNSLTNTCQPINLNIPYMDVNVSIPCMQPIITNKMPLLANLIKIVVNGFIVYRILLDIFQIVRNAKNPEDDRIEVLDL